MQALLLLCRRHVGTGKLQHARQHVMSRHVSQDTSCLSFRAVTQQVEFGLYRPRIAVKTLRIKRLCRFFCAFQIMNFQIVPAAGLIPQAAAVPIYGAPASSPLLGQVVGAGSLLRPRPGQLPLLAAQGGGIAATSPASQAALLSGIRQPLGQPTMAGGQAMLAGGARLIVPPSSQAMYMMQSLSGGAAAAGGMVPTVDPASLMSSGTGATADDILRSSRGGPQPDGKYEN